MKEYRFSTILWGRVLFYICVTGLVSVFCNNSPVLAEPIVEVEFYSCPTQIAVDQLIDVRVRIKVTGLESTPPWKVLELSLRDQDTAGTYEVIKIVSSPTTLTELGKWEYYSFTDIDPTKWGDIDNGVNDVELYVNAKVDDNIGNGYWLVAKTAVRKVVINQPILVVDLQILGQSSVNAGQDIYYTAKAIYSDGSTKMVTYGCVWDIELKNYASINASAKLSVSTALPGNQYVQIFATYNEKGITIHAQRSVKVISAQNPSSISPLAQYVPATTGKVFFSLASMARSSTFQFNASVDDKCDWINLQSSSGSSDGIIQVIYEPNQATQRQCVVTVKSDSVEVGSFQIIQAGVLDNFDIDKDTNVDLYDLLKLLKYLSGDNFK